MSFVGEVAISPSRSMSLLLRVWSDRLGLKLVEPRDSLEAPSRDNTCLKTNVVDYREFIGPENVISHMTSCQPFDFFNRPKIGTLPEAWRFWGESFGTKKLKTGASGRIKPRLSCLVSVATKSHLIGSFLNTLWSIILSIVFMVNVYHRAKLPSDVSQDGNWILYRLIEWEIVLMRSKLSQTIKIWRATTTSLSVSLCSSLHRICLWNDNCQFRPDIQLLTL